MNDVKLSNVPTMSIGKTIETLSLAYGEILKKGLPIRTMPSVMLWGPPGVGKSQAIREIARNLEAETGTRVRVTDGRLLRGIPTANADKTLAVWLKPQIFQMDASDGVVNLLFLDEISAAPQSVQAAAYQITLDRVVGEHKLPENCIVIAAGNRTTDRSVAYKMPKALANRFLHIEVEGNFSSWKAWAIENGINEKVVGFLSFRQNYLMGFDPSRDDLAFLNGVGGEVEALKPLIAGLVGSGVAAEFMTWTRVYNDLPSLDDIFDGRMPEVPKSTDALYALISAMTVYAREHKDDLVRIEQSIRYADRLPPDFGTVLLKDYTYIEKDYQKKLLTIPAFSKWLSSKGRLLNAAVK